MAYFNFFYLLIITHFVLAGAYKFYIYYLFKTYQIEFKRSSAFFSLVRNEIKEKIEAHKDHKKSYLDLKRLLLLHNILSITGKIILIIFSLIILFLIYGKCRHL